MLGVTENGSVTAMKKEGSGSLDVSSVEDMLEVLYLGAIKSIFRVPTKRDSNQSPQQLARRMKFQL